MLLDRPFQALTPTVDGDVMSVLAGADASFTPGEVHRLLDRHSVAGVRLALNRLVEHGVVLSSRAGRAVMYRLNRDHVLAGPIIEVAQARDRVIDRLRGELSNWSPSCSYAAVFGSAATNEMSTGSDIDILVVRPDTVDAEDDVWASQIDDLSDRCSRWTGNDCRVLELSEAEVEDRPGVVEDIADVGLHLAGPLRYLKQDV